MALRLRLRGSAVIARTHSAIGVIAPFDYTQLVWASFIGLFVWGEFPSLFTLVGAVIVAASGVYILHRELRRFRRPA